MSAASRGRHWLPSWEGCQDNVSLFSENQDVGKERRKTMSICCFNRRAGSSFSVSLLQAC